jgi:tRNA 2-thiouridine synthesizing protein A
MPAEADITLDATGLNCPLPLLKMKQELNRMNSGQVLFVTTTDVGSVRDFKAFLSQAGHALLHLSEEQQRYLFWIKKR